LQQPHIVLQNIIHVTWYYYINNTLFKIPNVNLPIKCKN
jgi:hypothetical protein